MFRDRAQEALQAAAVTTLHRIRTQAEGLRPQLATLVRHVAENLFDPDLNVSSARRATGIRDQSLSTILRDSLGKPLRVTIEEARIEVAERLLRTTDLEIGRISQAVGFACHSTFIRAFVRVTGKRPKDVRGPAVEPAIDYATWYRTLRGELDDGEAGRVLEVLRRLYPKADSAEPNGESKLTQTSRIVDVNGADFERFRAQQIWQEIRDLPPALQKQRVALHRFHSPAFFDLLRNESRHQGRRDRQRGITLAELALDSLEGCDDIFGERIHDLRALGWAWLGNAQRLALDFPAAVAAFEKADRTWANQRDIHDLRILGRISNLSGTLRMFLREYTEAFRLVDRSQSLLQMSNDALGEARAWIQMGAIQGYSGEPTLELTAFQNAARLLEERHDPYLALITSANLAKTLTKIGQYDAATERLSEAKKRCRQLGYWLQWHQIQWVEADLRFAMGDLNAAQHLYSYGRTGFGEAKDVGCFGLISLDLALLYSHQNRWPEVLDLASEAIKVLEPLRLYDETLVALKALSEAVRAGEVQRCLLQKVRQSLNQDPLARLRQQSRDREEIPAPRSD